MTNAPRDIRRSAERNIRKLRKAEQPKPPQPGKLPAIVGNALARLMSMNPQTKQPEGALGKLAEVANWLANVLACDPDSKAIGMVAIQKIVDFCEDTLARFDELSEELMEMNTNGLASSDSNGDESAPHDPSAGAVDQSGNSEPVNG